MKVNIEGKTCSLTEKGLLLIHTQLASKLAKKL